MHYISFTGAQNAIDVGKLHPNMHIYVYMSIGIHYGA